jgi:hypothetical protein
MTNTVSLKYQLAASYGGFVIMVLYALCWGVLGHGAPPVSPNLSAAALAAFYSLHNGPILLGMTLAAVVGGLWIPWTAQLTLIMLRIEGKAPLLTIIQLIGGILTAWVLVSCPAIWATAAFRPDLDPATIRMLSDLGFIIFNITFMPTTFQAVAAGLVGLAEAGKAPVFPRWVCYVAIAAGLSNLSVTLVTLFKTGPLAWDGGFNFYVPGGAFYLWGLTMTWFMVKDAHSRLAAEGAAGRVPAGTRPVTEGAEYGISTLDY